jgi:hypothetical protein
LFQLTKEWKGGSEESNFRTAEKAKRA